MPVFYTTYTHTPFYSFNQPLNSTLWSTDNTFSSLCHSFFRDLTTPPFYKTDLAPLSQPRGGRCFFYRSINVGTSERPDIQSTKQVSKERFRPCSGSDRVQPHTASAVYQENVKAKQKELSDIIEKAIEEFQQYFAQAHADGIPLKNFDDLCKIRTDFWKTQQQVVKNGISTICEAVRQQAFLKESLAVDNAIFKQLNKTCSFAHNSPPLLNSNLAHIETIANDLLQELSSENIGVKTAPISFKELSMHIAKSSNAPALKARLGALEAFLLAERRSNALLVEMLIEEQRHFHEKGDESIADEYSEIIAKFKTVIAKYKLNTQLGSSFTYQEYRTQWNLAREFAEEKRNLFRSSW